MNIEKQIQKSIIFMKKRKMSLLKKETMNNGLDVKLTFERGIFIVFYHTGNYLIQGKIDKTAQITMKKDLDEYLSQTMDNNIFIVYGHDQSSRDNIELMLRKWSLKPIILDEVITKGSQTIIEKLEEQIQGCNYGIVIATPDDIGGSASKPDEISYRVRQNVVLELGMLMASNHLGRNRIIILMKNDNLDKIFERPSDIDGLIYMSFKKSVNEIEHQIYKQLISAGFEISEV